MKSIIRQEVKEDYPVVFQLMEKAFKSEIYSDHTEQFLVERLRSSASFIPELSLVAIYDQKIVGHILLTKITIQNHEKSVNSLALAPVSVLPEYQRKGIGSNLIHTAHQIETKNKKHQCLGDQLEGACKKNMLLLQSIKKRASALTETDTLLPT